MVWLDLGIGLKEFDSEVLTDYEVAVDHWLWSSVSCDLILTCQYCPSFKSVAKVKIIRVTEMIQKQTWSYTFVCSFIFENAVCNAQPCSTGAASVCSDMAAASEYSAWHFTY